MPTGKNQGLELSEQKDNNLEDESNIPNDFLNLPKGEIKVTHLAKSLGFNGHIRLTRLAKDSFGELPFPPFWDYVSVEKFSDNKASQLAKFEVGSTISPTILP